VGPWTCNGGRMVGKFASRFKISFYDSKWTVFHTAVWLLFPPSTVRLLWFRIATASPFLRETTCFSPRQMRCC
jgi:hypothetical protein